MKKIGLFIIGLLFIFPVVVFAADPQVKTVTASVDGSTISYSGTTDEGITAVMCKLYKGDTEVKKLSSEVDNKAFSGSFTAPSNGDYKVYCARYEGGTVVASETVTVTNVASNTNTTSNNATPANNSNSSTTSNATGTTEGNPSTLDNIKFFVVIFVVALAGLVSVIVIKKKKNI